MLTMRAGGHHMCSQDACACACACTNVLWSPHMCCKSFSTSCPSAWPLAYAAIFRAICGRVKAHPLATAPIATVPSAGTREYSPVRTYACVHIGMHACMHVYVAWREGLLSDSTCDAQIDQCTHAVHANRRGHVHMHAQLHVVKSTVRASGIHQADRCLASR